MKDLAPFLVPGKTVNDLTGLSPEFGGSLVRLFTEAPPEVQQGLRITSAFRSPDRQAQLYREAVAKYGSEQAARKWVAPPGRSKHNHGMAVDLKFLAPHVQKWVHANAAKYGLAFPMKHEPWHVEPIGARGKVPMLARTAPPPSAGQPQPVSQPSAPVLASSQYNQYAPPLTAPTFGEPPALFSSPISSETPIFLPPETGLAGLFGGQGTSIKDAQSQRQAAQKQRLAMLFEPLVAAPSPDAYNPRATSVNVI